MHNNNIFYWKSLFIILMLLGANCMVAQTYKPMEDKNRMKGIIREMADNTNSIQSNFLQEKQLSFLTEKITSKGKFYYKKTDKIRWEYQEPFDYLILFNGTAIVIKDNTKTSYFNADENPMFSEINKMMMGTVNGSLFTNEEQFKTTAFESKTDYKLQLIPLQSEMASLIHSIQIFIAKKDLQVSAIQINESKEDYTQIHFTNRKINHALPEDIFTVQSDL